MRPIGRPIRDGQRRERGAARPPAHATPSTAEALGGYGNQAEGARASEASFTARGKWPRISLIVDKSKAHLTSPPGSTAAVIKARDTSVGQLSASTDPPPVGNTPDDDLNGLLLELIVDNPGINTTGLRNASAPAAITGIVSTKLAAYLN